MKVGYVLTLGQTSSSSSVPPQFVPEGYISFWGFIINTPCGLRNLVCLRLINGFMLRVYTYIFTNQPSDNATPYSVAMNATLLTINLRIYLFGLLFVSLS